MRRGHIGTTMYLRSLLLSASLLCLIHEGRAEPQYVLSMPSLMKSGYIEKICVNLKGHEQALDLNVVMEYKGENITIFSEDVPAKDFFQCNDVTIPTVKESEPVFVSFSAVGGSTKHLDRKAVVIEPMKNMDFIQMDKPIYRPGENVRWRMISLDAELKPVESQYPVVYVKDPIGSRIAQWNNQQSEHGIVSMEIQTISDAASGSYSIIAEKDSGAVVSQWFTLEPFVLPKFSVDVQSPNTLSVMDEAMKFNVTAIYTYGQPVPGSVTVKCCMNPSVYGRRRNCYKYKDGFCTNITGTLESDGSFKGNVDLSLFPAELTGSQNNLNLDIVVSEEGTGTQVRETHYVWTSSQLANLNFEIQNEFYKRGLSYPIKVQLTNEKGEPMANEEIELEIDDLKLQTITTNTEGIATYELDTSNIVAPNVTITAHYKNPDQCYFTSWREFPDYPTSKQTLQRFYSQSGSFLEVQPPKTDLSCGKSYSIDVRYILSKEGIGKESSKAQFYYQVMSRSAIVQSGQQEVDVTNSMNGSFSINLSVTSDLAPSPVLIVYAILEKEVIVDNARLNVETCFKNQVSLSFSEEQGAPGSTVNLLFSGAANSLCAMRVIDKSLTLLNRYESFTAENVYYSIPYLSLYGYNVGSLNLEDAAPPCSDPNKQVFYNGNYWLPVSSWREGDSYSKLKEVGLMFRTEAIMRKPEICGMEKKNGGPVAFAEISDRALSTTGLGRGFGAGGFGGGGTIETVRKNWQDNWVWIAAPTDLQGNGSLELVVPDSITQWLGSMFCMSKEEGFGMTKTPSTFTSFLPFFVELSMPYSIIRGETMVLRAFVSNYLDFCTKIRVTLENSPDFVTELKEGELETCVCSGDRASYMWNLDAKKIGEVSITMSAETLLIGKSCDGPNDASQPPRKDIVIKTIIVESEGIKREVTTSNLICVQDANSETPISLTVPETVVEGSVGGFVTILSDPIGLPLQNLQKLLQMPLGCGEQNMARMAPIPHVLEYLNKTGQLTDEILEKGKRFLIEGYMRQLGYRLYDGSFAPFSGPGAQGSSWLTAYTYRTFEDSKNLIFIDDDIQQQSLIQLGNLQKLDNGCFKPTGNMFGLQGEAEEELIFTAYLGIALATSKHSLAISLMEGAMNCLMQAKNTSQSTRVQAMMAYAFALAEKHKERDEVLSSLLPKGIAKAGTIHWETGKKPERSFSIFLPPLYSSAEVEITAYVLLSLIQRTDISKEDMTYMAQVAVWLTQQQNSFGGFRTTQDTVVALNALSRFAHLIYIPDAHHDVAVRSGTATSGYTEVSQFTLIKENRLLVQRQSLPKVPGDYNIAVNGKGCCLVQATARYNIQVPKGNSAFSLSAKTSADSCINNVAFTFTLTIEISYQGLNEKSGMTIIEVRLPSGYLTDYQSIRKLKDDNLVSKTEEQNGHLIIYMESVSKNTTVIPIKVEMGNRVINVKESTILAYDYYNEEENAATTYSHPCAAQQ